MLSESLKISSLCLISVPCADSSPFSIHIAPCDCTTPNAYFESAQMFIHLQFISARGCVSRATAPCHGQHSRKQWLMPSGHWVIILLDDQFIRLPIIVFAQIVCDLSITGCPIILLYVISCS